MCGFGEWWNDRDTARELRIGARIIERDHKRVVGMLGYLSVSRRDEVVSDGWLKVVGGLRHQMREANPIQDAFRRCEDTDLHGLKDGTLQSGLRNGHVDVL